MVIDNILLADNGSSVGQKRADSVLKWYYCDRQSIIQQWLLMLCALQGANDTVRQPVCLATRVNAVSN